MSVFTHIASDSAWSHKGTEGGKHRCGQLGAYQSSQVSVLLEGASWRTLVSHVVIEVPLGCVTLLQAECEHSSVCQWQYPVSKRCRKVSPGNWCGWSHVCR